MNNNLSPSPQANQNGQASFVVAVIGLCFAALGAAWSFIGGVCCGWAGWGWAFIGLVLAIVSLALKQSGIGWTALGLAIFAFAWVFVSGFLLGVGTVGAGRAVVGGVNGSARVVPHVRPSTRMPRQWNGGANGSSGARSTR